MRNIRLLDCTLRDGAYINGADFGESAIHGIIKKLCEETSTIRMHFYFIIIIYTQIWIGFS